MRRRTYRRLLALTGTLLALAALLHALLIEAPRDLASHSAVPLASRAPHALPIALAAYPALIEEPLHPSQAATELIGADRWRAAGFTGHGVRVAIVDTGFAGYEAHLGTSLPAAVRTRSFRADGDLAAKSDHGTLAARIVSNIAPGAQLYLLNFQTVAELSALVDYTIAQGITVVSFSIGFVHNGPGNGAGPVNEIVSRSVAAGAFWSVAAGNWAQQHWAGPFTDRNNNSIHEFTSGVEDNGRNYRTGDLILVSLRWDDPWGESCNDYDVELFGPDGSLVRASRTIQTCKSDPIEGMQVLATLDGRYRARIIKTAGAQVKRVDLLMLGTPDRGEGIEVPVVASSLTEPADHPGVFTVGAANPLLPQQLARFSSRGPTTDGRPKPELVSPTGVATGADAAFGGTSAAAPHAAAAAALIVEAFPGASAPAIAAQLRARAAKLPPPAIDSEVGAGALQLGALTGLGTLLPRDAATATLTELSAPNAPVAVFRYRGPALYPARFSYMLTPNREPHAIYRLDLGRLRFDTFVPRAPAIVNTFDVFQDGELLIFTFAP